MAGRAVLAKHLKHYIVLLHEFDSKYVGDRSQENLDAVKTIARDPLSAAIRAYDKIEMEDASYGPHTDNWSWARWVEVFEGGEPVASFSAREVRRLALQR